MNLFFLSIIACIFIGIVTGWNAAELKTSNHLVYAGLGVVLGLIAYIGTLSPGLILMKLYYADDNNSKSNYLSKVGGVALMIGGFTAPISAFYITKFVLKIIS